MKKQSIYVLVAAVIIMLTSACEQAESSVSSREAPAQTPVEKKHDDKQGKKQSLIKQAPILIIIDQTPLEESLGNGFNFTVEQIPDGYALDEMRWESEQTRVVNTFIEASEHGASGEKGFYISGDGQFSGFMYDDKMKGEHGQVTFVFRNDDMEALIWKQSITLK
ncbi:hypothetical protein NQ117_00805 [Paenibacillus sp. SC116]|uniref:hypothetical protein n=1 Tax=Paenibacillus sp. SC116 TaxID=2968986 RepID=UPI00215AEFF4|nr:hypothetical protein [Paenibacillus sp. SC116]MCR8842213.1 hypothetical protein [Paenibacillus sp. SC116]